MPQFKFSDRTVIKLDASQYFDSLHLSDASLIDQMKRVAQQPALDFKPPLESTIAEGDEGQKSLMTTLLKAQDAVKELQTQLYPDLAPAHDQGWAVISDSDPVTPETAPSLDPVLTWEPLPPCAPLTTKAWRSSQSNLMPLASTVFLLGLCAPLVYGGYRICVAEAACDISLLRRIPTWVQERSPRSGSAEFSPVVPPPGPSALSPAPPAPMPTDQAEIAAISAPTLPLPDTFSPAVNFATTAADQAQTAQTMTEWAAVAEAWMQALGAMQAIPPTHPRYAVAQSKVDEYARNLAYAQHNALNINQHLEFRQGVLAATRAAELTQTAQTAAEWQAVATEWQQAIAAMQAVQPSSTYRAIAVAKVTEYSRNFRYAEKNSHHSK